MSTITGFGDDGVKHEFPKLLKPNGNDPLEPDDKDTSDVLLDPKF